ncbi:hypothetical protein [Jannaschia sp. R86511]|uniref:hypothetical protein n=1 Tax=Jannaschia sp. R86511 TaxID=3093853 RepID=UPI0036D3F000
MTDRDTARAAKEQLRTELRRLPGVAAVGLGRRPDGYVITVTVTERSTCAHVPPHFHGVTVEVRVSGPVRALPAEGAAGSGRTDAPAESPSPGVSSEPGVTSDPGAGPAAAPGAAARP